MQISGRFTIALHIFACVEYFKDKEKMDCFISMRSQILLAL